MIKKTPKGSFRFSLISANSRTILTSMNYAALSNCEAGIETIKKNAGIPVEDQNLKRRDVPSSRPILLRPISSAIG